MRLETPLAEDPSARVAEDLARLRQFAGTPPEFWPLFVRACAELNRAVGALLVLAGPETPPAWKKLAQWPVHPPADAAWAEFTRQAAALAEDAARSGQAVRNLNGTPVGAPLPVGVGLRLDLPGLAGACVLLSFLRTVSDAQVEGALERLRLAADVPRAWQAWQTLAAARVEAEKFSGTLDLLAQTNREKRFMPAAMAFCNALAARHQCQRVSLGWNERNQVRLRALSHTESFDRHLALLAALEYAMEEALDQDEEVVWPRPDNLDAIVRDHEAYARESGVEFLASLPLRADGEVVGVVTCERRAGAFGSEELAVLRLAADHATPRLAELRRSDRWFGARALAAARRGCAWVVGAEHTWAKAIGLLAAVALVLLATLRLPYRLEGKFVLQSDETLYLTAPFDGFIAKVPVRIGDTAQRGELLLALAREELELEEAGADADLGRYTREAEASRAAGKLAEMRIAQAQADQARARLELVRHRLARAELRAPHPVALVEGDQRERLGAPVKQGEVLFKVARLDRLFAEAGLDERDIHELRPGLSGQIAFASQPKLKFPIRLVQVQAAATPRQGQNVFLARCAPTGPAPAWWRPGMTGVAKLDTGKRPLLWILTHRTVDYLRMLLWW